MENIDLVRPLDINELLERQRMPCVSLYMPTHRVSEQKRQDPLRLKNLVRQAEHALENSGTKPARARELLEPLVGLIQDYSFWKAQSEGLAIFVSPDTLRYYHLPFPFNELIVTGNHFHFKPLIPLMSEDGMFYILVLSLHQVRLFQANRYNIGEIHVGKGFPTDARRMKVHHDTERHLDFHNSKTPGQHHPDTGRLPYFFGHGAGRECRKDDILQFCERVAWGIKGLLREDHHPLILAGVKYISDMYRHTTRYPHVLEREITGNQDITTVRQLHKAALAIAEPAFAHSREQAKQAYRDLSGTMRADNSLPRILAAAYEGLVQTVFVPIGTQRWGTFDAKLGTAILHDREEPGDQDLLDTAALYTIGHKGTVYTSSPEDMPGPGLLNAIYRF